MTTASEKAGSFLSSSAPSVTPGQTRVATGDHARLRELMQRDDEFTEDEATEFADLAGKWRGGTLEGNPSRIVRTRASVAGERGDESGRAPSRSSSASQQAADILNGRG